MLNKILFEAICIARKDFKSKQVALPSLVLLVGIVALVIFCAASGIESFLMPNAVCWFVLPLAIGPLIGVPVGSNILLSERKTTMLEVLLASGVSPLAFVIGKSIKPFAWGVAGALLSELAAQCTFAVVGSSFFMYPLSVPFAVALILGTALASLLITGFAIAYTNETFIAGVILAIVLAPSLLIGNLAYSSSSLFLASSALCAVYAALCLFAILLSLRLLKQGSKYRLASS